jgi:hypothetical protein
MKFANFVPGLDVVPLTESGCETGFSPVRRMRRVFSAPCARARVRATLMQTKTKNSFQKYISRLTRLTRLIPYESISYGGFFRLSIQLSTSQVNFMSQITSRTIRCTEENLPEFKQALRDWPELGTLCRDLIAQGIFPGLRSLQITLTGSKEGVAQGLGAIPALIASKAAKTESTTTEGTPS